MLFNVHVHVLMFDFIVLCHQTHTTVCTSGADLLFVLDNSGSVRTCNPCNSTNDNWLKILHFVNNVTSNFVIDQKDTRVGLIKFSTTVKDVFFFNTYSNKYDIASRVLSTVFDGGLTNTASALSRAKNVHFTESKGDRPDVANILVLVVDGKPSLSSALASTYARQMRNLGVSILVIGVGRFVTREMVSDYASLPKVENETYWLLSDFTELENVDIVSQISEVICNISAEINGEIVNGLFS